MHNLPEIDFSVSRETAWLYAAVVGVVGAGILFSLYAEAHLLPPPTASSHVAIEQEGVHRADAIRSPSPTVIDGLEHNASTGLSRLILQLAIILSVLLRLFFAFIGLRTQIGLLDNSWDWLICLVIIVVATVGKLGGTSVVSRVMKMSWRESLQLGALMNTRGLMELSVLNIGYDLGILWLRSSTMLAIMALVTTIMTGPLVTFFGKTHTIVRR
jgi:hypothetical protein